MYPRLVIDRQKIKENTALLAEKAARMHIDLYTVSKVYCGIPAIVQASIDGGAKAVADSRLENFEKMGAINCDKVLLRLPMQSEVDRVIALCDISLNSEIETIKMLNQAAGKMSKKHRVILMIDLGDLREGILKSDVDETVKAIMGMEHIVLEGIGVNLTCYGGVIPGPENLGELASIAEKIEREYGIALNVVSGGNSSSLSLIDNGKMPTKINNLRLGEAIVLGRETAYGNTIIGAHEDAFVLEAEIIELKMKDSMPTGEIGVDAFGNKPNFVDKGKMLRAIAAIGRQDINPEGLTPLDERIEIIGASSDHMIMDLTKTGSSYQVGQIVQFRLDYGAMLKACTSEYIHKIII
ncbi:ornithine racemase Orr [Fusibacter ferrireducens]|uniref:Alanine/ornithine racemase family PLP-dependent enzyme n=1 Tax=Fusibacter ferrireducens TaxID=2785058 RepID=A0ABR9ZTE7_9FIRM|nr:ornithine racemase Orr [Fusibacter ferrireducens]MBF4693725.1 alanine/ornithine racemase family PLP-dependent enzyme [Fusibacter ferrireducens]